jgi:Peptidase_G2, IMC autoproteolytic cleavage domain
MVTKATRDVIDLRVRAIDDGILVNGDCSANFAFNGTTIGLSTPCDGAFVNLSATNLTVTGTIDGTGATVVGEWQATYADIAERYESDKDYAPGTVVKIGGDKEITATDVSVDDVFGVISTNPAYVLNSGQEGLYLPVVVVGRIPVRVTGPIAKGDRLVSSNTPGVARAVRGSELSCHTPIFGRALEDSVDKGERLVEVAFITIR